MDLFRELTGLSALPCAYMERHQQGIKLHLLPWYRSASVSENVMIIWRTKVPVPAESSDRRRQLMAHLIARPQGALVKLPPSIVPLQATMKASFTPAPRF